MQDEYDCNFCVVDLHAVTNTKDHKLQQSLAGLREWTLSSSALYIAAGIGEERGNVQSAKQLKHQRIAATKSSNS